MKTRFTKYTFGNPVSLASVLLSLSLYGCGSSPDQVPTSTTPGSTTETGTLTQPSVETSNAPVTVPTTTTPIHFKDITYRIESVLGAHSVGSSYNAVTAPSGWGYVVVKYSIQNDGTESKTVYSDDFVVTTDDGTIYEPDREGTRSLSSEYSSQLHPGSRKDRVLVYQIPLTGFSKTPLMHIGETQGGWSIAAVPLSDWHGEVLFQPGAEHQGNEPPNTSLVSPVSSSQLYTCPHDYKTFVIALDCASAAASFDASSSNHYANSKGLIRRSQFEPVSSDEMVILERYGKYVKVQVVDGSHKGRVGWLSQGALVAKKPVEQAPTAPQAVGAEEHTEAAGTTGDSFSNEQSGETAPQNYSQAPATDTSNGGTEQQAPGTDQQ